MSEIIVKRASSPKWDVELITTRKTYEEMRTIIKSALNGGERT